MSLPRHGICAIHEMPKKVYGNGAGGTRARCPECKNESVRRTREAKRRRDTAGATRHDREVRAAVLRYIREGGAEHDDHLAIEVAVDPEFWT